MTLKVRPPAYALPSYSLTADLLSFNRCGLQYRMTRLGRLPTSQPVQLWFGEFIHGVLEEAFRSRKERKPDRSGNIAAFTRDEISDMCALITRRLAARGLLPRDADLESLAHARAQTIIQELGPHLFPLIHQAEVRLYGARELPSPAVANPLRNTERYEMVGVVDVVSHISLASRGASRNPIIEHLRGFVPDPAQCFEVIIDYKGMRRPRIAGTQTGSLWEQYEWQLQTYAELRRKQVGAWPVVAGVLLYLNELHPSDTDMEALKRDLKEKASDVLPAPGSADHDAIMGWTKKTRTTLSFEFRLRRALRVVRISEASVSKALKEFDAVVQRIETCRNQEANGTPVLQAWTRNHSEEGTCTVCDSRTYCPDYRKHYARKNDELVPRLPCVKTT